MEVTSVLVFLAAVVCWVSCKDDFLPSYITPCDRDQGDEFEACVKKQIELSLPQFTKGIPELDVPSIDPVNIDDIKIDGNGLKLLLSEAQLHGLSKSELTDFKLNLIDEKFSLAFKTNLTVTGKYSIDGKILILPIKGKGDSVIKCRNMDVTIKSKLGHTANTTADHFKLSTPSYSYKIEKTIFKFQNLFNGNKQLSDATHKFANENWQQIMDDLAPPAVKQIVKNVIRVINKFFAKVTVEQIIKNYKHSDN